MNEDNERRISYDNVLDNINKSLIEIKVLLGNEFDNINRRFQGYKDHAVDIEKRTEKLEALVNQIIGVGVAFTVIIGWIVLFMSDK